MEIVTGEVVDGKVVVEGGVLREGAKVTVVLETNDELSLSPEQNELLVRSVEQANRGEVVDGWVLLRDLKSIA
jgi:hypothetical protein